MLPFMADATNGDTLRDEIRERYLQTLRHAWGSKEIGYMLGQIFDHPEVERKSALRPCFASRMTFCWQGQAGSFLTVGAQLPVVLHPEIAPFQSIGCCTRPNQRPEHYRAGFHYPSSLVAADCCRPDSAGVGTCFWYQDVQVRPARTQPPTLAGTVLGGAEFAVAAHYHADCAGDSCHSSPNRLMLGQPLQFRVSKKV